MGITKSGIITSNEFDETDAMDIITSMINNRSYVPAADTDNSCLHNIATLMFDEADITYDENTVFRVIARVSWSGFDESSTAGTFNIYFQGNRYNTTTSEWDWLNINPITTALGNAQNLKNLVLSADKGSFVYDTTFSLTTGWISTYSGVHVGIRANYSNGVGRITLEDIKVILDKYSSSTDTKAHVGADYFSGREFIEI
jgi:hypothetical protein